MAEAVSLEYLLRNTASIQQFATTRIEILGFTPEQIDRYVTESLPEGEAKKLITAIRKNPNLPGNCSLPLSIAIITHTYISMGHELPATFCQIIMELALSCLYRYIKKCTPYGYLYVTLTHLMIYRMQREHNSILCVKWHIPCIQVTATGRILV